MDKAKLVREMQHEHPLVTLNVGTIKENSTRALTKCVGDNEEISPTPNAEPVPPLIDLQPNIRNCLQEVVRLASQTKRICQRAIAVYLERLSVSDIDPKVSAIENFLRLNGSTRNPRRIAPMSPMETVTFVFQSWNWSQFMEGQGTPE
ncbi:hypothetical protein BGZ65_001144, partial [Modicella reniformis]